MQHNRSNHQGRKRKRNDIPLLQQQLATGYREGGSSLKVIFPEAAQDWPALPEIVNKDLERIVFTHKSCIRDHLNRIKGEEQATLHNERLEFLGDAFIGAIITHMLYERFPNLKEGHMGAMKSLFVSNQTWSIVSRHYGLHRKLQVSPSAEMDGIRSREKIVSDVFEAYVGGILKDSGTFVENYLKLETFVRQLFEPTMRSQEKYYNTQMSINKMAKQDLWTLIGGKALNIEYKWDGKGGNRIGGYNVTLSIEGQVIETEWGESIRDAGLRAAMKVIANPSLVQKWIDSKETRYAALQVQQEAGTKDGEIEQSERKKIKK
jgi:ribonuclease-3